MFTTSFGGVGLQIMNDIGGGLNSMSATCFCCVLRVWRGGVLVMVMALDLLATSCGSAKISGINSVHMCLCAHTPVDYGIIFTLLSSSAFACC